jgi:Tfp pilus assembly protein PilV
MYIVLPKFNFTYNLQKLVRFRNKTRGFSLVEVTIALGIFVFAGFALIGLLAVALQNNSDSKQRLQAATIAEFICSTRRACPTTDLSTLQPNFPLPTLVTSANNYSTPAYLTWNGSATTLANGDARFGLIYSISVPTGYAPPPPPTTPSKATVYLYIYWPALAPPSSATTGHFELTTTMALP